MRQYETSIDALLHSKRPDARATQEKVSGQAGLVTGATAQQTARAKNAGADPNGDALSCADQLEQQEEAAAAAIDQYVLAARAARRAAAASQSSGEDLGKATAESAVGGNEAERPIAEAAPVTELTSGEQVSEISPVTEAVKMPVAANGDSKGAAQEFRPWQIVRMNWQILCSRLLAPHRLRYRKIFFRSFAPSTGR